MIHTKNDFPLPIFRKRLKLQEELSLKLIACLHGTDFAGIPTIGTAFTKKSCIGTAFTGISFGFVDVVFSIVPGF